MGFLAQLIQVDFVALMVLGYLLIFMHTNDAFDHNINKVFRRSLVVQMLLTVSDNIEFYCSSLSKVSPVYKYAVMSGYILRITVLMTSVFIFLRGNVTKKQRILLYIPSIANALLVLCILFTDKIVWIDSANVLHRYPVSYISDVIGFIYFFCVVGIARKRSKLGHRDEALLMYIALGAVCVAVLAENVLRTRGVLVAAVMLMLTFYYLYLHTEHFKRDNLTGAFNRMTFFNNLGKYHESEITAFCEFDLNNLKQINDVDGHAAGDAAIVTAARIIEKYLPKHCYLYRFGGDEFAVLYRRVTPETAQASVEDIRKAFAASPYSCAAGLAVWSEGTNFTEVYNIADERMYADKRIQKSKNG